MACTERSWVFFSVLTQLLSLLIDLATTTSRSDREKDLEILLLRRQLAILMRSQAPAPRVSRWEKVGLAVLAAKLGHLSIGGRTRLRQSLLLFTPETVLGWHRAQTDYMGDCGVALASDRGAGIVRASRTAGTQLCCCAGASGLSRRSNVAGMMSIADSLKLVAWTAALLGPDALDPAAPLAPSRHVRSR
jgi:hypothetical protein